MLVPKIDACLKLAAPNLVLKTLTDRENSHAGGETKHTIHPANSATDHSERSP